MSLIIFAIWCVARGFIFGRRMFKVLKFLCISAIMRFIIVIKFSLFLLARLMILSSISVMLRIYFSL